ncbi:hypothetical protein evm_010649 [Chilo suppressalis]|nr:hypothetical protein evm_010649 [Chilo suppressalis]
MALHSRFSELTKWYETKNSNIIDDALKIILGDAPIPLKLQRSGESKENVKDIKIEECSIKKELSDSFQNVSFKEESLIEIEGTPGRTSPIIQSIKIRNGLNNHSSDYRDKKKCPEDWPTPEKKAVKLIYPTPTKGRGKGKLRQSRLSVVTHKTNTFVDLTSSPELMSRDSLNDSKPLVEALVKKESTDNDETILPSPTSGPPKYPSLLKNTLKSSPFKKPPLSLKTKSECKFAQNDDYEKINSPIIKNEQSENYEESINLLNPLRIPKDTKENCTKKELSMDYDETHCEIASSLSILQRVDMLSPSKRPLEENKNIVNVSPQPVTDSSMSLLVPEKTRDAAEDNVKSKILDRVEPVYKEPVLRKKAEKRALPGWSCDECKNFYAELYKDNPEMLAKKMEECSKHRGKNNPVRPNTPEGFWNPRWDVPDDTEEFNRRNNAV